MPNRSPNCGPGAKAVNSRKAITMLQEHGYEVVRRGKGDHLILGHPNGARIILSNGKHEMSAGMVAKVRSHLNDAACTRRHKVAR